MSLLTDDIINEMKADLKINKAELERIVYSQFKTLELHIKAKVQKEVHIKGIGKFKPIKKFVKYELPKEAERHNTGIQESLV